MNVKKEMKTKLFEFDPVVYPFPLLVCKYVPGVTAKELSERFNQVIDRRTIQVLTEDDLRAFPTLTAKTVCVTDKVTDEMKYLVILYRPKKIRWGVVSHEALHVLDFLADWLGFKAPVVCDDEPHAYFIEWVANCIGSVIDGYPEKMMKGKLLKFEDYATETNQSNAGGQD